MKKVTLYPPGKLQFGAGSFDSLAEEIIGLKASRVFILTFKEIREVIAPVLASIEAGNMAVEVDESIVKEPSIGDFKRVLSHADTFSPDVVIGIGGGSVMDVAKLVAALLDNPQKVEDVFGINVLETRTTKLVCVPTTSGTGSEMSPNAILLDEKDNLKKGIISPHLVPDLTCIDPILTTSVPPSVTAATGIDAFTHCLEAYVNNFAHPLVDTLALDGIRLIFENLQKAVTDPGNVEARSAVSLGSMYGGMCLGPVNTTAIHALSYPLGSEFQIAHGLSNALLVIPIMKFNAAVASSRYASIARALGVMDEDDEAAAQKLIDLVRDWLTVLKIPKGLSEIGIPQESIPGMAKAAITVQRLLINNPREVKEEDAVQIYINAF